MITNHIYNQYDPQDPSARDTVFFFRRGEVLIRALPSGEYRCPTVEEAGSQCLRYLFRIDDTCYFMRAEPEILLGRHFLGEPSVVLEIHDHFRTQTGNNLILPS